MPKLKVVLDTNFVISSLWGGRCWEVLRFWRDGRCALAISPAILQEYLDVLKRFVDPVLLKEWASVLTDPTRVVHVEPNESNSVITADPPDNRFLECAVAAHADAIVSGDRHLKALRAFRGIPILTPAAFLHAYR